MKIDAIQTLIDISEQEELVEVARAELADLEAENAAMREALQQISCLGTDCAPEDRLSLFVESQLYTAISVAARALSSGHIRDATKKVLVDVEKLREVYVAFNTFLGVDPGIYPVVLDWLAEILKEAS